MWWVNLGSWVRMDDATQAGVSRRHGFCQELIASAQREGRHEVHFHARGHPYLIDISAMSQINMNTLMQRDIKATEEDEEPSEDMSEEEDSEMEPPWLQPRSSREVAAAPTRDKRTTALVDLLLTPAVQVGLRERSERSEVPLPAEATEEAEKLSKEAVERISMEFVWSAGG